MLIVNDDHLRRAGVASLEERCVYCLKRLVAYPLIMSDDTRQTVYHVTCALELVSDLLADVFTFFRPPGPYPPLFVLTTSEEASPLPEQHSERRRMEGDFHAGKGYSPD